MRSRRLVFRGGRRWLGGRLWVRRRRMLLRAVGDDQGEDACVCAVLATRFEEVWGDSGGSEDSLDKRWARSGSYGCWMLDARPLVLKDARTTTQQRLEKNSMPLETGPRTFCCAAFADTHLAKALSGDNPVRRRLSRHHEAFTHQDWHIECLPLYLPIF